MKALGITLQQLLYGPNQYVTPVFQRYYVWKKKNWKQLWEDITLLLDKPDEKRRHFMGSVVCVPWSIQPGAMPTFLVIDGQQRLITLSILLCALRDAAFRLGWVKLAEQVEENYLIHRYNKGNERFRVLTRQLDRPSYVALVGHKAGEASGQLREAYDYLSKELANDGFLSAEEKLRDLFDNMVSRLDFVSITLDDENPYKIFKSLNFSGVDLEQGDLIRNHVFMALPLDKQDEFDKQQWIPLESHFLADGKPVLDDNPVLDGKAFTAFFRDVLMRKGNYIGALAVYEAFEGDYPLTSTKTTELVADLERMAKHHDIIRGKKKHTSEDVDGAIRAIRSLNATTAYPLVLALLDAHETDKLSRPDLMECLRAISGFVLRRYACNQGSRAYGRWFCAACNVLGDNPLPNLTAFLQSKRWPNDADFLPRFQRLNLYEGAYSRAILEGIELSLQHDCERVMLDKCTIEHVMPQSITDDDDGRAWQADLGNDWRQVHL